MRLVPHTARGAVTEIAVCCPATSLSAAQPQGAGAVLWPRGRAGAKRGEGCKPPLVALALRYVCNGSRASRFLSGARQHGIDADHVPYELITLMC
jgi:hypothetical protein